jgi:glycosyltransferase involved in cell wall biosynthesis
VTAGHERAGYSTGRSMNDTQAPKASVVMPARNAAATIAEQMGALAEQTFDEDWELIVVDDASTDATAEIAAEWSDKFQTLRILRCARPEGAAHARNKGTRAARGRFLAYCDADDVVSQRWLAGLVSVLSDSENSIASGPRDLSKLNSKRLYSWRKASMIHPGHEKGYLAEVSASNMAVRREAFDLVGGFDESLVTGEDCDFAWRIQLAGGAVGSTADAVVHYRLRHGWSYLGRYFQFGLGHVQQYVRFGPSGMPRSPCRGLLRVVAVALTAPAVLVPSYRYRWMSAAGIALGRLAGSIRLRVLYL